MKTEQMLGVALLALALWFLMKRRECICTQVDSTIRYDM